MKTIQRITTLVVAAMLLAAPTFAQNATKPSPKESRQRVCHTMGNLDRLMQENAKMARRMALIEKQTETYMRQVQAEPAQRSQLVVTIPVVFHILYNTAGENISEAQVMSQLDILNEDFRRLNADQDNVWSQAADTQIEFCLASQDPNGNPTDGILRVPTNVTSFGTNDAMKFTSQGGSDAWPAADYMNFWVCDLGSSLLGYAQFPGGPATPMALCAITRPRATRGQLLHRLTLDAPPPTRWGTISTCVTFGATVDAGPLILSTTPLILTGPTTDALWEAPPVERQTWSRTTWTTPTTLA